MTFFNYFNLNLKQFLLPTGDEELSSDSDDERLIYSENLSPSDVKMYGLAYASFKKRALKEMNSSDSDCDYISSKSHESDED